MSQYIKDDNIVRVSTSSTLTISPKLPCGTYLLELDAQTRQFYLRQIEDFKPAGKVYGRHQAIVERIISTFQSREGHNLGVLLSGVKGSGKTLTTKMVSVELANRLHYPTIIINRGYDTAQMAAFLHSIDVPCMVIFDEFDKVYSYHEDEAANQSGLLDILDGVFESRKLFLMSCNSTHNLNPYFFNRPGRIFYHYRYGALTEEVISEYCDNTLLYPIWKPEIMQLAAIVNDMTFDILKAVVEETNRYNESPRHFIEQMNVTYSLNGTYDVEIYLADGKLVASARKQNIAFGNRGFGIHLARTPENLALTRMKGSFLRDDEDDDEVYGYYTPELADLATVRRDGSFVLKIAGGALCAVLTRSTFDTLDYATLTSKM